MKDKLIMETTDGVFSVAYDTEVIEGDISDDKSQIEQPITVPYSKVTVCKRVTRNKCILTAKGML